MTTIFSLFSKEELEQQIADKMVTVRQHPTERLSILNYTQAAQYTPEKWNHVTDYCRGLIYDTDTYEIKARGFKKFWNLEDERHPETLLENLPSKAPLLTQKLDGSLGIGYRLSNGKWAVATRGSFTSDQAKWATEWIQSKNLALYPAFNPVFEILYKENRIVVDYDEEGLTLLSLIHTELGHEAHHDYATYWGKYNGLKVVKQHDGPLSEVVGLDTPNEEGWVASWSRPTGPPLRVKIKYDTYCRLHKLYTQTSPWRVWDMLRNGRVEEARQGMPEDFRKWFDGQVDRFTKAFEEVWDSAFGKFEDGIVMFGEPSKDNKEHRKQFAQYAAQQQPYTSLLFAWLDGKDVSPIIWKMIEPSGAEKPFKEEAE